MRKYKRYLLNVKGICDLCDFSYNDSLISFKSYRAYQILQLLVTDFFNQFKNDFRKIIRINLTERK
jgi:hypothetical protein